MKTWVKYWLYFLNGVFIAALAFLDDPAAIWILLAYGASGPLLVWFMVRQRGLTRLLGVAHLVPWVPLVGYLVLRLSSDLAGPMVAYSAGPALATYLYLLLACLVLCLALDVWDLVRYARGERHVLGSPEALTNGRKPERL